MKRKGMENVLGTVVLIATITGAAVILVSWFSGFVSEMQEKSSVRANEERGMASEKMAIDIFDGTNLVLRNTGITNIILRKSDSHSPSGNTVIILYKDDRKGQGYLPQVGLNIVWEKKVAGVWTKLDLLGNDVFLESGELVRVSGNNLFTFGPNDPPPMYEIMTEKEVMLIFGKGFPNIFTVTADPPRIPSTAVSHINAFITDLYGNPVPGETVDFAVLEPLPFDGTLSAPSDVTDSNGVASVDLSATHDMTVRVRATLRRDPAINGDVRVVIYGTTITRRDVRAVTYSYGRKTSTVRPYQYSCSSSLSEFIDKQYMKTDGTLEMSKCYCDELVRGAHNRYIMFEVDLRGTNQQIPKDAIIDSVTIGFRHWESFYTTITNGRNGCSGSVGEGLTSSSQSPPMYGPGSHCNGSGCTPIYNTLWYLDPYGGQNIYRPMGYPIGQGYYSGTGTYATNRYGWWCHEGDCHFATQHCSITDMWTYVQDLDDRLNDDVWLFYLDHSVNSHDISNPNTIRGVAKEDNIVNFVYLGNLYPVGPNEPVGSKTLANLQFADTYGFPYATPDLKNYINTPDDANHFAIGVYFENSLVQQLTPGVIRINYFTVTVSYHLPG